MAIYAIASLMTLICLQFIADLRAIGESLILPAGFSEAPASE